jgi:hypothetical protein
MLVIMLVCIAGLSKKSWADFGKSGWPIFKKAQAANSRGIVSSFGTYGSLSGIFYNPALLAARDRREAFLFSESGMVGDTLGGALYSEPLRNGAIAGGLVGYDAGSIELNWIENGELKTQNASAQRDLLGIVSYGRRLRSDLFVGGSIKAATSQIAERNSANAFAADIGAAYVSPKGLTVSAALQNVGTSTKFVEKENPLPTSVYAGAGYTTKIKNYNLLTGAGVTYNMVDDRYTPEVGAELRYQFISMNVGYRFNMQEQVLTLGLGVKFDNIEVGYAYVPGIYLGATHRMNVSYKFRTPFEKKAAQKNGMTTTSATSSTVKPAVKTTGKQTVTPRTTVRRTTVNTSSTQQKRVKSVD